jgi:hypothetical protein
MTKILTRNLYLFRQIKHTVKTALIPVVLRQQFQVTKTLHRHYCTDLSEIPLRYYYGNVERSDGDSKKFVLWGLPFQCRHPEVTTVKQVKEEGRKEGRKELRVRMQRTTHGSAEVHSLQQQTWPQADKDWGVKLPVRRMVPSEKGEHDSPQTNPAT